MYGLLTKCEVKMAGYWPSSFFASLRSLRTETGSRSINSKKKERGHYQAILIEQANRCRLCRYMWGINEMWAVLVYAGD